MFVKKQFENNPKELIIIQEFEIKYDRSKAIGWYTRECCLYRILNKALRIQNTDALFIFGFFSKRYF